MPEFQSDLVLFNRRLRDAAEHPERHDLEALLHEAATKLEDYQQALMNALAYTPREEVPADVKTMGDLVALALERTRIERERFFAMGLGDEDPD